MGEYRRIEVIVGIFVFIGIVSMGYMALKLGEVGGLGATGYELTARFSNVGGVRPGADVMIAGVSVGRVEKLRLSKSDQALVTLRINNDVKVSDDAIVSVRTKGIIGDRYLRISQGADDTYLKNGDEIIETESAINLEDLVAKYVFSGSKP
ncbi:MAG TPA: outer membrane lipid asymmetry maintenance protein MlaD [Mariprofundaceae bacterium]|nr:outer membrane lipid asymmetry maintenance protein MlaD [Mariprofundaceae bacterium]